MKETYEIPDTSEFGGVIYALHNGDHEFRYVGQTRQLLKQRFKQHLNDAKSGGGFAVHDWIRKHGPENIRVCILATVQEHELEWLDSLEIFHIAQYRDLIEEKNLNLTEGGSSPRRPKGFEHSEETKAKIGISNKGKHDGKTPWNKGGTMSAEFRSNLSVISRNRTPEHRNKLSESQSGAKNHF